MKQKRALENQIRLGKRVRVTDGTKADIFSRPGAETFRVEQRLAERCAILSFCKRNSPAQHAPAEVAYSLPARDGGSHRAQVGVRQDCGVRKQPHILSRRWMRDRRSIVVHELADQICSLRCRNQLPKDRTDCRFERIPPSRQSQPRRALAKSCEQRNSPKASLDHHGITVQIEHFSYSLDDIGSYLGLVRCDVNF